MVGAPVPKILSLVVRVQVDFARLIRFVTSFSFLLLFQFFELRLMMGVEVLLEVSYVFALFPLQKFSLRRQHKWPSICRWHKLSRSSKYNSSDWQPYQAMLNQAAHMNDQSHQDCVPRACILIIFSVTNQYWYCHNQINRYRFNTDILNIGAGTDADADASIGVILQ